MKMKKIISALLMGAAAAGIATADLSIKASPKVSGHWFRYNDPDDIKNLSASGSKDKTLFLLDGYAKATKGDLTMTASGNIFTFTATLVPDLRSDIEAKTLTVQAKLGNFTLKTGFDNGGISTYGATISNGNDEGRFANAYKLGSPFSNTPLIMSNNQTAFGKDQKDYFVHGKYALGLGDVLTLNIAASVMSPHGWNNSQNQATGKTSKNYYMTSFGTKTRGGKTLYLSNRSVGWGVFLNPVVKNIVGIEAFAKGVRLDDKNSDNGSAHGSYNYVLGGYASLLCVPLITKSAFGGSVWLCDSTLQEWSADLDLSFKFGNITLAWDNKFGAMIDNVKKVNGTVKTRGASAATNVGYGTTYQNNYLLYNALRLSLPLNDTLTVIGSIGQQSGFGDGQKGTTLYVYPQVQMSVTSAATLSAGAAVTLDRIGAKNFAKDTGTDKMALLVNVPVVVKFSL